MCQLDPGLLSAAEELTSRIRHHASIPFLSASDPAEVVAAADAVGIAAEEYSAKVFDLTEYVVGVASEDDLRRFVVSREL